MGHGYLFGYLFFPSDLILNKKRRSKKTDRPHYQLELTNRVLAVAFESTLRFLFLQALTWHYTAGV